MGDRWPENGLQPPRGPHGAPQACAAWGVHLHRGPLLSSPVSTEARAQRAFADMASFYIWGPVILPRAPHWGKRNHRPEGTKVWPPEATCWKIDFLLFIRRQDGKEPLTLPSLSESPPPVPARGLRLGGMFFSLAAALSSVRVTGPQGGARKPEAQSPTTSNPPSPPQGRSS